MSGSRRPLDFSVSRFISCSNTYRRTNTDPFVEVVVKVFFPGLLYFMSTKSSASVLPWSSTL